MIAKPGLTATRIAPLVVLILAQSLCIVVFLADVSLDFLPQGWAAFGRVTNWSELAAITGLILGILFETGVLIRLMQQQARMRQSLSVAAGALSDLMTGYFESWGLTPTEQDVATFTIKGYAIAEIAELRGSAEGTIKTHLNAIYRKSGCSGRGQLVSVLVEDLFQAPLLAA